MMAERVSPKKRKNVSEENHGARIGIEEELWRLANSLRGKIEPADYKHLVLSVLFLRTLTETKSAKIKLSENLNLRDIAQSKNARADFERYVSSIERENPNLLGSIPSPPATVPDATLASVVRAVCDFSIPEEGSVARDLLGRVYEYFLAKFASSEGRSGGEYYTPKSVVKLLVEILNPTGGTIYDPCCGTAGMFVQSEEFISKHGGSSEALRVIGQESSLTTWKLAQMNLIIHGLTGDLGKRNADTFSEDQHPNLKADYAIANPPFNQKNWSGEIGSDDERWKFGPPSPANANYAKHLRGQTLFVDARSFGHLVDRTHASLSAHEIKQVADVFHEWRANEDFQERPGFATSATIEEISDHRYALVPGRYVGFSADVTGYDRSQIRQELPEALWRLNTVSELAKVTATNLERLLG